MYSLKLTDIFYKLIYRTKDIILKIFWKFQLAKLGKGSLIRSKTRILGNPKRIRIGNHFKVYENCIIAIGKGEIQIGSNGLIGVGTYINVGNEKLSIGDGVAIAPYCKIFTYSHHYFSDIEIINSYKAGDVVIEDNVLIGTNTIILPGTKIGKGSIIAAGSVVNHDIPHNAVFGGAPAKLIKMREVENSGSL